MIKTGYFICRLIVRQSCSIVQNPVVNYHLVVSYPQQFHIGIKVSHWCAIIIVIYKTLLFAFSRAEHWIIFISYSHNCHMYRKTKSLTLQAMLCQNVTLFLPKTLPSCFSNVGKNWKRVGIQIWHISEDHLFEMIWM